MIWEIKSSRDFARWEVAGFATAFIGAVFASWGAPAGLSNSAGITRSALCVGGGSVAVVTSMGAVTPVGTPSGVLGGVPDGAVDSAAATKVVSSGGTDSGAGGRGRLGMSTTVVRSCLVDIGVRDMN